MVMVCGIDGSEPSWQAARVAASLARRTAEGLRLVHVQEAIAFALSPLAGATPVALTNTALVEAQRERMQTALDDEARRLARTFEIEVTTEIRVGLPDLELERCAQEVDATLLLVGSLGRRWGSRWRLGSTADRLSRSPVPVLVVRDARPFERWAFEERALRVVLALDRDEASAAAVRAAGALRERGPCDVVEVHVYDPVHEARRLGLRDAEGSETRVAIESTLARELSGRAGELRGRGEVRFTALPARGRTAETLAEFADGERADLLILGARGWTGWPQRLGSVTFGVLPLLETNVLVVHPSAAGRAGPREPVAVQSALVATDLSETGKRAVDLALSVLPERSRLVLLHVLTPSGIPSLFAAGQPLLYPQPAVDLCITRALAEAELKQLLPAAERTLECRIEVAESDDVATAILQAAERHDVDLLCLGTHGRGRIAGALLGSVAREVARRSPRPVLLAPPARES